MYSKSKDDLLKDLKAVIRQKFLLDKWNRKTHNLQNTDATKIEYDAIIMQLVNRFGMTPEQIAEEISK